MSLVARLTPGGLLLAFFLAALVGAVATCAFYAVLRAIARRRRLARRMRASLDPASGLPSRVRLARDLRVLSRAAGAAGTHLFATFELPRLGAYEHAHGAEAARELTQRLGRRLSNAVGRAGSAYALGDGSFGLLARLGRGSDRAFLRVATAALTEAAGGVSGVGAVAQPATVALLREASSAREALRWLGDPAAVEQSGLTEDVALELAGEPDRDGEAPEPLRTRSLVAALERAAGTLVALAPTPHLRTHSGAHRSPAGEGHGAPPGDPGLGGEAGAAEDPAEPGRPARSRRVALKRERRPGHEGHAPARGRLRRSHRPLRSSSSALVAAARRRGREPRNPPPRWLPYIKVSTRFRISVGCGLAWMLLSAWLAWPWIEDLSSSLTLPVAVLLIVGIALIPGYLNIQLITALLLDHPAPIDFDFEYPPLTLLVAVYNEEADIAQTLAYAMEQEYPAPLRVIVIDDGSTDETVRIAQSFARLDGRLRVIEVPHGGKALALNAGLRATTTPLVATIDADTLLMPDSLRRVVSRMLLSPQDTVAVAGSVMVRNTRQSLMAAAQTWDYLLGIGSIKREQAFLQGTLVAQGAFSVYDTAALKASGAWPDCIGEDIVMTWAMLARGGRTSYEPTAIAFTEAPATLRSFARQRRRWARGMIEGLRIHGRTLLGKRLPYAHSVATDVIFPFLDVAFTLGFVPGIVLAAFGNYAIVGPMTLAVLPLNVVIFSIMYRRQRRSFEHAGLKVRQHAVGFFVYLLGFQLIMSPVSVAGYVQEMFHATRRW
jgi:biofilm PGA synthesis N-glycosyltransferase PgaC